MEKTYRSGGERRIHTQDSMEKKGKRTVSSPGARVRAQRGWRRARVARFHRYPGRKKRIRRSL
jgi:hypothetical protein